MYIRFNHLVHAVKSLPTLIVAYMVRQTGFFVLTHYILDCRVPLGVL